VKSAEQQGRLIQHGTRDLLLRQRTQVINALRAHLAELGIVAAQGRDGLKELLAIIADGASHERRSGLQNANWKRTARGSISVGRS
jgi:transposase